MLRVLAPVVHPDEVPMLAGAGAAELYGGVQPRAWAQRYSRAAWLSRRGPGASLPDLSALELTAKRARAAGLGFNLALNASHYAAGQLAEVANLAEHVVSRLGVSAVIVADVGLMTELGRRSVPFVASTVAVAHNAEALRLFRDLGAVRAVLPRHLHLFEIEAMVRASEPMELEAFVLFDNCAFEEGLCRTKHEVAETGAFCQTPWRYELRRLDPKAESDGEAARWTETIDAYREWLRWTDACGSAFSAEKLPNGACGLCAIHGLREAGIRTVKLAGRQGSAYRRLRGVQMVARIAAAIEAGASASESATLSRALRNTPELCDSVSMCYYPGSG